MPISNKGFQEHDFFLHSLRSEITTHWASSPFATVQKFFLWRSGPTFCPQPETSKQAQFPGIFDQNRNFEETQEKLASAGNGELNPKRRERRHSREYQHRDAEQAEEEEIPGNRLRPHAGSAGSSDAMMEMTGGDVTSPHDRDHADYREDEQPDD